MRRFGIHNLVSESQAVTAVNGVDCIEAVFEDENSFKWALTGMFQSLYHRSVEAGTPYQRLWLLFFERIPA